MAGTGPLRARGRRVRAPRPASRRGARRADGPRRVGRRDPRAARPSRPSRRRAGGARGRRRRRRPARALGAAGGRRLAPGDRRPPVAHVSASARLGAGIVVGARCGRRRRHRLGEHALVGRGALSAITPPGGGRRPQSGRERCRPRSAREGAMIGMGALIADHVRSARTPSWPPGAVVVRDVAPGAGSRAFPPGRSPAETMIRARARLARRTAASSAATSASGRLEAASSALEARLEAPSGIAAQPAQSTAPFAARVDRAAHPRRRRPRQPPPATCCAPSAGHDAPWDEPSRWSRSHPHPRPPTLAGALDPVRAGADPRAPRGARGRRRRPPGDRRGGRARSATRACASSTYHSSWAPIGSAPADRGDAHPQRGATGSPAAAGWSTSTTTTRWSRRRRAAARPRARDRLEVVYGVSSTPAGRPAPSARRLSAPLGHFGWQGAVVHAGPAVLRARASRGRPRRARRLVPGRAHAPRRRTHRPP